MIDIDITKTYVGRTVLKVRSLHIEKGKSYALIGSNGSGKSTLLKLISGIVKPDAGSISVSPENTDIAFMPQQCYAFSVSVMKNLFAAFTDNEMKSKNECTKKCEFLLKKTDLYRLKNQNGTKLSGGEIQKMCLCRMLVKPHDLLLLDEPTSAMDSPSISICEEMLREYVKANSTTLLFATHSVNQARRLADKIIFLSNGEIAEISSDAEIGFPKTSELAEFLKNS